ANARVRNLPAGKSVLLRGITFDVTLNLEDSGGAIWVEDCVTVFNVPPLRDGIVARGCDSVVLLRTQARGSPAEFCTLTPVLAGNGLVVLADSSVHAYACRFEGGQGGTFFHLIFKSCEGLPPGSGVVVDRNSGSPLVFLSDCTVRGGNGGG